MNTEFKDMAGAEIVGQSQDSTTPSLHHPNTPVLPRSDTPTLQHSRSPVTWLAVVGLAVCALFGKPLYSWVWFSWNSDLYSHCLLIPFVSVYFVWIRRGEVTGRRWGQWLAIVPLLIGATLLTVYWSSRSAGAGLGLETWLFLLVTGFLCFLYAGWIGLMGWQNFKQFQFPALFLLFMAPFPSGLLAWIETFLQHGSAIVAHSLFAVSGLPVLRDTTHFQLPGIRMHVATECSGIHSTLVLFITSVVAGYFFLKRPRHRAILAVAIIPLALLRNGFRIFTIGQLCVHYGPQMFDSYIHRRGGPIFFALSLIPLFLLLLLLLKFERTKGILKD